MDRNLFTVEHACPQPLSPGAALADSTDCILPCLAIRAGLLLHSAPHPRISSLAAEVLAPLSAEEPVDLL